MRRPGKLSAEQLGFNLCFASVSITLTQLRSFLAVVRGGSVTAAADALVVTQPSVSAAVTALSREVGVKLLERDGRGVRPTPAGREFAAYAADVVGLLEQGRRAAGEAEGRVGRELRIAAVTTAAESFVPPIMRAFQSTRPHIGLRLEVGNRDGVLAMVLGHDADVAVGGNPPRDGRIEAHAIRPNRLVLIAAADDPLAGRGPVAAEALGGRTWLLREPGSGTRLANEAFLADAGIEAETLTLGSNGAIRQAARAGLGVSFVSRDAVVTELDARLLGVIEVDPAPATRQWYAMRSSVGPARAAVTEFMEFVAPPG